MPPERGRVMDQDLQDLLALWRGDHDSGEGRREALLARLREDDSFRRAFVEEIRPRGMLKAVQSAEPRWLRLEDEIGWTARQREEVEALAERVVHEGKRRLRIRRLARWGAALAAAVAGAGALGLAFPPGARAPAPPSGAAHAGMEIAAAIKVEDMRWEPGEGATPGEGTVVTSGRLRLASGRLTLAFFSGVALTVEGPADLELRAADRVFCHYGKLRARVPRGA